MKDNCFRNVKKIFQENTIPVYVKPKHTIGILIQFQIFSLPNHILNKKNTFYSNISLYGTMTDQSSEIMVSLK